MTESPTVSAGAWFTVAEPLTVYADDDRTRRIGSLPESGRYKVIAVDDGFVGVPGPGGATGWIRRADLAVAGEIEEQAQPEPAAEEALSRKAPDGTSVSRKPMRPSEVAASVPSSDPEISTSTVRRKISPAVWALVALSWALAIVAGWIVFTMPVSTLRSHWLAAPGDTDLPFLEFGTHTWAQGALACVLLASVIAVGAAKSQRARAALGAAGLALVAVLLWRRLAREVGEDWFGTYVIDYAPPFRVASLFLAAAAMVVIAAVAFAHGRSALGVLLGVAAVAVGVLGALNPLFSWGPKPYTAQFAACDEAVVLEDLDEVLLVDHQIWEGGWSGSDELVSTVRMVRPQTQVFVLDWFSCSTSFEPAEGARGLPTAWHVSGEPARPGRLNLFVGGELVRTGNWFDVEPARFADWLTD